MLASIGYSASLYIFYLFLLFLFSVIGHQLVTYFEGKKSGDGVISLILYLSDSVIHSNYKLF